MRGEHLRSCCRAAAFQPWYRCATVNNSEVMERWGSVRAAALFVSGHNVCCLLGGCAVAMEMGVGWHSGVLAWGCWQQQHICPGVKHWGSPSCCLGPFPLFLSAVPWNLVVKQMMLPSFRARVEEFCCWGFCKNTQCQKVSVTVRWGPVGIWSWNLSLI